MVKAFTIMELVVALLLSAILTGIVFYSYLLLNNQFRKYSVKSDTVNEYLIFQKALNRDIERCDYFKDTLSQTSILFKMPAEDFLISYLWSKQAVIREAGNSIDTFHFKLVGYDPHFIKNDLPFMNKIILTLDIDDIEVRPVFTKHYSAKQLMALEPISNE